MAVVVFLKTKLPVGGEAGRFTNSFLGVRYVQADRIAFLCTDLSFIEALLITGFKLDPEAQMTLAKSITYVPALLARSCIAYHGGSQETPSVRKSR